jgi:hypothetical protein
VSAIAENEKLQHLGILHWHTIHMNFCENSSNGQELKRKTQAAW